MVDNPVTISELQSALWHYIDEEVARLAPYLQDDELTVKRLVDRYPGKFKNQDAGRKFLDELVDAGKLEKQLRRLPEGGARTFIYVEKGKQ